MKKKSIIGMFVALLGLGMTTTSCEDMLTPEIDRYTTEFSGRDTVNFYFGILSCLQDVAENNLLLGELRGDLVSSTTYVSDSVGNILNFTKTEDGENAILDRSAYYKVINQCNYYLAAVDTLAQKNNIYYMRREFAQVQFVRAWTYMQLVQNYGEVPFITSPVSNANTGWENGEDGVMVNADNLLEQLQKHGLDQAYEFQQTYGTPQYGSTNNGTMDINASLFVFPGDVVMGDLYLLRGASKSDYEKAASYYYNYLDEQCEKNSRMVSGRAYMNESGREPNIYYSYSTSSWMTNLFDRGSSLSATGEVVTLIPSAANTAMGTVLTRAAKIYGFNPSSTSSASTTTGTNSSGESETTYDVTGKITVTADYTSRQVTASNRYRSISDEQTYCVGVNSSGDDVTDATDEELVSVNYYTSGDARIGASVRSVSTAIGSLDFINKRATTGNYSYSGNVLQPVSTSAFSFNYTIPVYRMRQIYLRYAEAVNRAGYPRYAFAILRDGLNENTVPELRSDSLQLVSETDSLITYKRVRTVELQADGADIDVYEAYNASNVNWLDFSESRWDNNIGVHKVGSGTGFDLDTLYCYSTTVAQRIAEEQARVNGLSASSTKKLARRLKASLKDETETDADTVVIDITKDTEILDADVPTAPENLDEQINAVETLIADEMALETAFEGSRYYDLYRIARHKNAAMGSDYGTRWFAWQVARRGITPTASGVYYGKGPSSYSNPQNYDATLYSKLLDMNNWYLQNPQY